MTTSPDKPRCETCRHFQPAGIQPTFRGEAWQNDKCCHLIAMYYAGPRHEMGSDNMAKDFGCIHHEEKA